MILITGAAGFLGSGLVWYLNGQGHHDLVLVDELGTGEKFRNLAGLRFCDYLEREELLERIVNNRGLPSLQAVIHLGACSATTEDDGSYLMRNNFGYTRALAEWCCSAECGSSMHRVLLPTATVRWAMRMMKRWFRGYAR